MNISLTNVFNSPNSLGISRNATEKTPLQNVLAKNNDVMQARVEKIRERRLAEMQAKMIEEKLQDSLIPNANMGFTSALTTAIVSNDMALSRIADTAATKAGIESQIATEGATDELQEALARTDATLAAQIGNVLSNIDSQNSAIANAQNREEQPLETENLDISQYVSENSDNLDILQNGTQTIDQANQPSNTNTAAPTNNVPERVASAYRTPPPSGLVVDAAI